MLDFYPESHSHDSVLQTVYDGIPSGGFIIKSETLVPYSHVYDSTFRLIVSETGQQVRIYVIGLDSGDISPVRDTVVIPIRTEQTVFLKLFKGYNRIALRSSLGNMDLVIVADSLTTILDTVTVDMNRIMLARDSIQQSILDTFAGHPFEFLVPDSGLLPSFPSLRSFAARLLLKAFTNEGSTIQGSMDVLTALTLNTPLYERINNSGRHTDPINPVVNASKDFSGYDIHVWLPNLCFMHWLTLAKLANNVFGSKTVYIGDDAVAIQNDDSEIHTIITDLSQDECAFPPLVTCGEKILWASVDVGTHLFMCLGSYPYDIQVTPCLALGAKYFDCEVAFDSGLGHTWDTHDDTDPTGDGWLGQSLVKSGDDGRCADDTDGAGLADCASSTCCISPMITTLTNIYTTMDLDQTPVFTVTFN